MAAVKGHPLHPMMVPMVIGLYVGATGADIGFAASGDPFWARSASWLLLATVGAAMLAAVPGLIDLYSLPRARSLRTAWVHAAGNGVFLILAALNYALRQPDPAAASHGTLGLVLSLVGLVLLGGSGWLGGELTYRYGVGVAPSIKTSDHVPATVEASDVKRSLARKFWRKPPRRYGV